MSFFKTLTRALDVLDDMILEDVDDMVFEGDHIELVESSFDDSSLGLDLLEPVSLDVIGAGLDPFAI